MKTPRKKLEKHWKEHDVSPVMMGVIQKPNQWEKWDFNHQWGEYLIKELGLDDYLGLREYVKKEFTSLLAGLTKKA